MPERISITLIPRDDPALKHTAGWVVGLATGTSIVVIFPDRIGSYPHDSLEAVVRHEIVHLALNTRAAGRALPRWFHEGTAVTVASGWRARDEMRLLLAALDPPSIRRHRTTLPGPGLPGYRAGVPSRGGAGGSHPSASRWRRRRHDRRSRRRRTAVR